MTEYFPFDRDVIDIDISVSKTTLVLGKHDDMVYLQFLYDTFV